MQAVTVVPGTAGSAKLDDLPEPGAEAALGVNEQARVAGLRTALAMLALIALIGLVSAVESRPDHPQNHPHRVMPAHPGGPSVRKDGRPLHKE